MSLVHPGCSCVVFLVVAVVFVVSIGDVLGEGLAVVGGVVVVAPEVVFVMVGSEPTVVKIFVWVGDRRCLKFQWICESIECV